MTTDKPNLWNRLLEISDNHQNPDVKHHAKLLLNQYNTAGGMRIKNEVLNFLAAHEPEIVLPKIGDKVLRDGYKFTVSEVVPHRDLNIIASITLRGEGGTVEIGYFDYLLHKKVH